MQNKYSILIIWMFIVISCFQSYAIDFSAPAKAYDAGKYDDAIRGYREIMHFSGTSAPILFNLGNAYYMKHEFGEAMLCYQQAKRLAPSNPEIKNNIQVLENKVKDNNKTAAAGKNVNVDPDEKNFFQSIAEIVVVENSSDFWAVFAATSFILLTAFIALYLFGQNVVARKVGFFSSLIFLFFTIVFLSFSLSAAKEFAKHEDGVIMAKSVQLLSSPDSNASVESAPLTSGTKIKLIEEVIGSNGKPTWYKVRLNHDYHGWIQASSIKVI